MAAGPHGGLPALTDREFRLFQELIHRESGIFLADVKKALVLGRLSRRVRELALETFQAYYDLATSEPMEMVRMLDAITTNETHFFREQAQFALLSQTLCPAWREQAADGRRDRRLRVWSAACSSGEEPYSLAMLLHHELASQGWRVDIHATDLSTRMLERGRAAVWPREKARGIPEDWLRRYMLRGVGPEEGRVRAGPVLRDLVRFDRLNLQAPPYPVEGPFDVIFCRNVLIYFDTPSRRRVIAQLLGHIAPGGYLFLGHAESLMGMSDRAIPVRPAVYQTTSGAPQCV